MAIANYKNDPLLSICIPTFNRCCYLKKCIDSIVCEDDFINKKVEIVVSDNMSTDGTSELCKEYQEQYDNFVYSRNSENVKDVNFPLCLSKAHGVYRKMFNDTFLCIEGKLREMCNLIERYIDEKPQILWAISKYIIDDRKHKVQRLRFREFVLRASERMTSLIYFGIWQDDCNDILDDIDACKMKIWQADKTLKLANKKKSVIIYNNEIVTIQNAEGKNVTYNIFDTFHDNYLSVLMQYVKDGSAGDDFLSANDIKFVNRKMLFDTFFNWSMKWHDPKLNWIFNESEDLMDEIRKTYGKEWYYIVFLIKLYVAKTLRRIKRFLV